MFKQMAIVTAWILGSQYVSAQAIEGKVKFDKGEEPAIVMVYNYPKAVVDNAFAAKFADKQLKGIPNKDFLFYSDAIIDEISKSQLDYYLKAEETGKAGEPKTTVYLIMHGSGNIEGVDQLGNRSKTFLEKMADDVARSSTIAEIKKQEAILVDEENALTALQKEQKDLEEKMDAIRAKQQTQEKIINSQKALLDDLKAKLN